MEFKWETNIIFADFECIRSVWVWDDGMERVDHGNWMIGGDPYYARTFDIYKLKLQNMSVSKRAIKIAISQTKE